MLKVVCLFVLFSTSAFCFPFYMPDSTPDCIGKDFEIAELEYCSLPFVFFGTISCSKIVGLCQGKPYVKTVIRVLHQRRPDGLEEEYITVTQDESCGPHEPDADKLYVITAFEQSGNGHFHLPCDPWEECLQSELRMKINNQEPLCEFFDEFPFFRR